MTLHSQDSLLPLTVIDPGARVAEVECFNDICGLYGGPATYHLPAIAGTRSLRDVKKTSGIVILGSSTSVHDTKDWQIELSHWLKMKLDSGVPLLGLCYGHQLVAHLFGARVEFITENRDKIEGTRETEVRPFLGQPATKGPLVVTHRECVRELPKDFELLATSEAFRVDGMVHRNLPIWTFQAHLEANSAFAQNNMSCPIDERAREFGHRILNQIIRSFSERSQNQ